MQWCCLRPETGFRRGGEASFVAEALTRRYPVQVHRMAAEIILEDAVSDR